MKDLIDKVLKFLPRYFLLFGAIFSAPKAYFKKHKVTSDAAFGAALKFVGTSLVVVQFLQIQLIAGGDLWTYVAAQGAFWAIYVIIGGGANVLIWRLVGGKAPPRAIFVIYAYLLSISLVIVAFFQILFLAVVQAFEPHDKYLEIIAGLRVQTLVWDWQYWEKAKIATQFAGAIFAGGIALVFVWLIIAWGAYRHVNKADRRTSAFALTLAIVLTPPILVVLGQIGKVLSGKPG
jgi:hypothetical protein